MIKQIVEEVKAERIRQKVSMEYLSQQSGVSQKHISNIETGKATPTIETLARLAKPLGLEISLEVTAAE